MDTKTKGIIAVLSASVIWAIEPVLVKLSFANSNFLQTSAIRAIFVALTAFVYLFFTCRQNFKVSKKQLFAIGYIALAATLFADLLYYYALTSISVVSSVLIGHLQPLFIVLIGFFILKEDKLTKYDYIGVVLMLCAAFLVTTGSLDNLLSLKFGTTGDLLVLFSTIAWSTTAIAMRKYLKDLDPGTITFYRFLFASTVFGLYIVFSRSVYISNIYQPILGILIGIGCILYYYGLRRLKAAQVTSLELASPFFAAIFGFLILGETVTTMQVFGICLLFIGVYFISKTEEQVAAPFYE